MRAEIRQFALRTDNSDPRDSVGSTWIDDIEAVQVSVDLTDRILTSDDPSRFRISYMGNVLVGAETVWFAYCSNLVLGHDFV